MSLIRLENCCPTCGQSIHATFEKLDVVISDRKLVFRGQEIKLSPRETQVLRYLFRSYPAVVNRTWLFDAIWVKYAEQKVLEVYICHLRKVLKPLGIAIRTIYGVGYQLELPA